MRISDWSSDVCSSDLIETPVAAPVTETTEKAEEQPPLEAGKSIFNYPRSDTTSPRSIPSVPVGGELQSTSDGDDSSTKGNNVPEPKSDGNDNRSEERRLGKGDVRTVKSRWAPYHKKKQ